MSDEPAKPGSFREYQERQEAVTLDLMGQLASVGFDGPHRIEQPGLFGGFGAAPVLFAICGRCGAMVKLLDPKEQDDRPAIERGIDLHQEFHTRIGDHQ